MLADVGRSANFVRRFPYCSRLQRVALKMTMSMVRVENTLTAENRSTRRQSYRSDTSCTTNLACSDQGSNTGSPSDSWRLTTWTMSRPMWSQKNSFNTLNPELNPICYLMALLGTHHFLHVSRIRVKSLNFRRLMSYIYGTPILDVSRSHTTTQHSR